MIEEFKKFVNTFDLSIPELSYKYGHSIRVMDVAVKIAKSEGFNDYEIELARVIGLLHDYARFSQWTKYHTFNDSNSFDHGDEAVRLLKENDVIKLFWDNEDDYDLIFTAIKYHNKLKIDEMIDEKYIKFCKLIRDADKVDIFYAFTTDHKYTYTDDSEINIEIEKLFFEHKQVPFSLMKTRNDRVLVDLEFIYDLNYNISLEIIYKNKYLDKMYEDTENKKLFKKYFDEVKRYIEERIK